MFRNLLIIFAACMLPAMAFGQLSDDGKPVKVITNADITGTVTFSSDTVYNLDGFVFVEDGEVLNIDAGTIIKANTGQGVDASALIVAQGGTINAVGNANQPIVFTSILDDLDDNADILAGDAGRGLWGGVLILGRATMNTTAGSDNVEGLPASSNTLYGGSDDTDNSGTLQYVSIRHGGSVLGTANEINGLTLGAVGSGTTIDHIEIFQNLDDGIEFFGGTVNVTHAIVAFCADDSYDFDEGFSGAGQFWFTIQDSEASDQGGEHDGGTTPEDGTPYATPLISNATYLGAGYKTATGVNPGCFNIRDNCAPAYYNSIFTDHAGIALRIEDLASGEDSRARLEAGDLVFQNNAWGMFQAGSDPLAMADGQAWTETLFTDGSFENWITDPGIFVTRTATMDNDPRPSYPASLPNWTDPTAYNPPAKPGQGSNFVGFFDEVDYAGAFDPNATISELWVSNWTAFDFYGYLGENDGQCGGITDNGKPVRTITNADIVDTTIFSYDTVYNLDGFVFVDSGEVLEIEAGTIIKANTGQGVDASALIVSRGGKIYAQGTAECPIIFTSVLDDIDDVTDIPTGDAGRGLWGGVLILGNATMNTTAGSDNVEGLPASAGTLYGGTNDDDNSGAMHYVSIRHGGSVLGTANEINGLTLGAVGRGTQLDHIEIFQNLDDGIEWFGGTVNLTHSIVAFCGDDSYDFDEGFSGGGQYWFAIMDGESSDKSGEHDGGTTPEDGTPYATPLISNATYLGAGLYPINAGVNPGGFNIRDNCSPAYYNSIFHDQAGYGLVIEDLASGEDSRARLEAGDLVFQNNTWGNFAAGSSASALSNGQSWTETLFTNGSFNNLSADPGIFVTRTATADNDPRPKNSGLTSYSTPTAYNPPAKPNQGQNFVAFFDDVDYVGAFDPNADINSVWAAGWSAFDTYGYLGENDGTCNFTDDGKPVKTITDADITGTVHWVADTVYNLDGFVFVDSGEVLAIDPGTIIKANTGQGVDASALIVSRYGRIVANGSDCCPIVFTSILDDIDDINDIPAGDAGRGLWGGVLILGNATMNTTAGSDNVEGLPASAGTLYGGTDDEDNSGVLRYVSIRHGGSVLGTANEINGLTLGAVGSGTTLDYVEIFQNLDDGIEWFGGTVTLKHAVVAFCADDSYDFDEGFSGAGQFWFTIQDTISADQGGEHDGGTTPEDGTPYATPLISNVTYLGAGYQTASGVNPGCFNIRDNCAPAYYNSIFTDHAGIALKIEDLASGEDSRARLEAGDLVFQNNVWGLFAVGTTPLDLADGQTWTETLFTTPAFDNTISDPQVYVTRSATGDNDPRPKMASLPSYTDPTVYNPPAKPGQGLLFTNFFEPVDYVGAFDPNVAPENLWLACWTAFDQYGYLGENNGSSAGCCIGGTGNVNFDPADNVDISDLTKMVNHLFVTFEPLDCPGEANTNGDAGCNIDISDLTKLVNHLFITFEPLADCLPQCQTPAP